jgi:hypothetical protein
VDRSFVLPLTPLRGFSSFLQAELAALLCARVTLEEALGLELTTEGWLILLESTCEAVAESLSLGGDTTTIEVRRDRKLPYHVGKDSHNIGAHLGDWEIVFKLAVVNGNSRLGRRRKANTRDGSLPAADGLDIFIFFRSSHININQ